MRCAKPEPVLDGLLRPLNINCRQSKYRFTHFEMDDLMDMFSFEVHNAGVLPVEFSTAVAGATAIDGQPPATTTVQLGMASQNAGHHDADASRSVMGANAGGGVEPQPKGKIAALGLA